jgi:adenylyl cyclase-associated protein
MSSILPAMALTSILNRLEAATSRLEDMAMSLPEPTKSNDTLTPAANAAAVGPAAQTPKLVPKAEPVPESIEEFDSFCAASVKKFVNLSEELGGEVALQVSCRYYISLKVYLL